MRSPWFDLPDRLREIPSTPIRRMLLTGCARAVPGHAAALRSPVKFSDVLLRFGCATTAWALAPKAIPDRIELKLA